MKRLTALLPVETQREHLVRTVACPVCTREPGQRCYYTSYGGIMASHTGRYNAAAAAGLVPQLVGAP